MPIDPFKLERHFAKHEFSSKYLLSSSDPESLTVAEILKMSNTDTSLLTKCWLGYSESKGSPELRQEISKIYRSIGWEKILVHVGAQEPIFNFFLSILSTGDHVIVHYPCYQSYYSIPKALGASVELWEARIENQWKLDPNELRSMLKNRKTKALLINFPHNPTGAVPDLEEFREILNIAAEHDLYVLSDEVYRECELPGTPTLPNAADLYSKAVSLGVLSKTYGLPGLRLGWIATQDEKIFNLMCMAKDYTTICNPLITEIIGTAALKVRTELANRNRTLVASNLEIALQYFNQNQGHFEWVPPKGATMFFPRSKKMDMEVFSEILLEKTGTMLISGKHFDMPSSFFRIGLGRKDFESSFARFTRLLSES